MINFGVREVANSKATAAPGWAYVPDTGNASVTALQPSSRKRLRTEITSSQHETTAKQDAKIIRELAALDRENHRDVSIPVPIRHRDNAGRVSHGKVTTGVRKILQSQKTFANHLSDFEALTSSVPANSQPISTQATAPAIRSTSGITTPHGTSTLKRSHKKKDPNDPLAPAPLRRISTSSQNPIKSEEPLDDESNNAASPFFSLGISKEPPKHHDDNNPLLVSRIPSIPSDAEIMQLLAAPPLSYNEAKGSWTEEDRRKPARQFCEVCGYWGRVKCTRCGGRVCALECLGVHQEECFTRYGA